MRVKLDENLPVALANVLIAIGHDVDTVEQEHLTGRPDEAVWQATQAAERFLITQDLDFADTRQAVCAWDPPRRSVGPTGKPWTTRIA